MHVLFVTLLGLTLCAGLYALPSVARGEDVNYVSKSPSKSFFDSLDEHFADMEDKIRAADRKIITGEKEDSNSDSGTDAADTGRINDWGDHLDSTDHSSFDDGEVERDETTY
ncbi:hypothetical protein RI367_007029 [Sorochytrium milnesiophthora]